MEAGNQYFPKCTFFEIKQRYERAVNRIPSPTHTYSLYIRTHAHTPTPTHIHTRSYIHTHVLLYPIPFFQHSLIWYTLFQFLVYFNQLFSYFTQTSLSTFVWNPAYYVMPNCLHWAPLIVINTFPIRPYLNLLFAVRH